MRLWSIVLALQEGWSLARVSDLEHWVRWLDPLLTLSAEVEVISDGTFVSDTHNRVSVTPIADAVVVNNFGLLLSLLLEMCGQHFLVLLSAVSFHLVVKDLLKILEKLVVYLACSVALLARQTVLVDHLAIALEAFWEVLEVSRNLLLHQVLGLED